MHALRFFQQFLVEPKAISSIFPSSSEVGRQMARLARVKDANTVVEFGPGTGALTKAIIDELSPESMFFAIEVNPHFVEVMKKRFPDVSVFHDSAANTARYLQMLDRDHCDCVVSGLPWASFDDALQDELLGALLDVLSPGGHFVTFTYLQSPLLPSGRRFRRKIERHFNHVEVSPLVWRNVPPAYIYHATK